MKNIVLSLLLLMSTSAFGSPTEQSSSYKVIGEISGSVLHCLRISEIELKKLNVPDLEKYSVSVIENGDSVTVIYIKGVPEAGQRGAPRGGAGIEVEISKKTQKAPRVNYLR